MIQCNSVPKMMSAFVLSVIIASSHILFLTDRHFMTIQFNGLSCWLFCLGAFLSGWETRIRI